MASVSADHMQRALSSFDDPSTILFGGSEGAMVETVEKVEEMENGGNFENGGKRENGGKCGNGGKWVKNAKF